MYNYYLSIMFMLNILLWVVYLYILYTIGFLKFSDLIRLSGPVLDFNIDPQGVMFRIHLKLSVFTVSYSSLGQTRLCPKECSIAKQRFFVILWHFLEHFWCLVMLFAGYSLPVLAVLQLSKPSFACCYRLCMD